MDGCIYRTKDGECNLYAEGGKYTAFCDLENCNERKPSNADRIRAMSDEELAQFLWFKVGKCPPFDVCPSQCIPCEAKDCWLEWLRKEADE